MCQRVTGACRAVPPAVQRVSERPRTSQRHGPGSLQEVFVTVYRKIGTFEGRADFHTWLYRVTVNAVGREHRMRKVRRWLFAESAEDPEAIGIDAKQPSQYEEKEKKEIVYRVLEKINERKRTVFVMYELEEMTAEEIARVLEIPVNTVYSRLHHARKEFRQHIKRLGADWLAPTTTATDP